MRIFVDRILTMELDKVLAIVLSLAAFIFSLFSFLKTRRITLYQDIDRLYFELLKLGIDNPRFTDVSYTGSYKESFTDDELRQYNVYAFIAWNICETIVDRRKDGTLFKTGGFFKTWEPVLRTENHLHRKWFESEENRTKFKQKFKDYMEKHYS